MKTISINLYSFEELNDKAKQKAIDEYYESEDYPFLSEDLTESVKAQLDEHNVKYNDIKLYCSLSYSQGDGLCFTGELIKGNTKLVLTHNYRYFFSSSVTMDFYNTETGEEDNISKDADELQSLYFEVCKSTEKEGYAILKYRMSFEEFNEYCQANDYTFTENA